MNNSQSLFAAAAALSLAASACSSDHRFSERSVHTQNALAAAALPAPQGPGAGKITSAGNDGRTGWYPDQAGLDPAIVSSATFGRRFDTLLSIEGNDQVFAQPLVVNGHVLVATESNHLYLLDAETGAVMKSVQVSKSGTPHAPWDPTAICGDLHPTIGITGTPVIDQATNTAYFFSKTYEADGSAAWYAHAVDVDSLAEHEESGFPIKIAGAASNHPEVQFDAFGQMQRVGLLLMDGVVYAGFGSHCDHNEADHVYRGWIVGVGTDGSIKTLFSTNGAGKHGGGVWHSGGGLVSDGPGRIFFETGNGYPVWDTSTPPTPGSAPPSQLAEAMVHADVQPDGSLRVADFFIPSNAADLDRRDDDLGSGGPISLPDDPFGTTPKLALGVGKEGLLYLFDRDHLGGYRQGPSGTDGVLNAVRADAGAWSRPSIWPGDGGYVYLTPNSKPLNVFRFGRDASDKPSLTRVGQSADKFGYTSGSPIVTSNGTQSGSALVWVITSTGSYGKGELHAYDAIPNAAGIVPLRYQDAIGTQAKFSEPGIGAGRVYVGTAGGHVIGYGAVPSPITSDRVDFDVLEPHTAKTLPLTITASQALTITGLSPTGAHGVFTLGSVSLPVSLDAGQSLVVPVTFTPDNVGTYVEALDVATSSGPGIASFKGIGRSAGGQLAVAPTAIDFGGMLVGAAKTASITVTNVGSQPLAFTSVAAPSDPYAFVGLPAAGQSLAPNESSIVTITFQPTTKASFARSLDFATTAGNGSVALRGYAADPGRLAISAPSLAFGDVAIGQRRAVPFTVKNAGGLDLIITKSKPPIASPFASESTIPEGTTLHAGQSLTQVVTFTPTDVGASSSEWIITADDDSGVQVVEAQGNGTATLPPVDYSTGFADVSGLELNRAAAQGGALVLTSGRGQTTSAFTRTTVPVGRFDTSFTLSQRQANGDGLTFTIQGMRPQIVGGGGSGLGYAGITKSVAIKFDLYSNQGEGPSSTGLYINGASPTKPAFAFDNGIDLHAEHPLDVAMHYDGVTLTVRVTDTVTSAISTRSYAVDIPHVVGGANAYVGFTAATGGASAAQSITTWSFTPVAPSDPASFAPQLLFATPAARPGCFTRVPAPLE